MNELDRTWNRDSLPFKYQAFRKRSTKRPIFHTRRMNNPDPVWMDSARRFCRESGIQIMGWGTDILLVEAKSPERAKQIASMLGQFGFKAIEDEDDAYAGILSLSINPVAVQEKIASFDISRRPIVDRILPLLWAAWSFAWLLPIAALRSSKISPHLLTLFVMASLCITIYEGGRI
jgi:hypothetical protein